MALNNNTIESSAAAGAVSWEEQWGLHSYATDGSAVRKIAVPVAEPQEQAEPVRKKSRATHKTFRPTLACYVLIGTVTFALVAYIWIIASSQMLLHQNTAIVNKIGQTRQSISVTQRSIAGIQVSPELAQWAVNHGWRMADQHDFDQIPVTPAQTRTAP